MNELKAWLPLLDPPPGGYARLATALSTRREAAARTIWHRRLIWAGASVAVAMIALVPVLRSADTQRQQADRIATSLAQAWALGDQEIVVTNGAATELMRAPGLRAYWIGTVSEVADSSGEE